MSEISDFLNELDLIAAGDLLPGLEVYPKAARLIRDLEDRFKTALAHMTNAAFAYEDEELIKICDELDPVEPVAQRGGA
jgi:hypothetical protein